ncbi:MAG: hypothetical protein NTX48_09350 [Planctomycetales bacterium]|nr:hypothetical protein [Planctomycetales bacterium]
MSDNPYAPPQETSLNQYPARASSHLHRMLVMLPFCFIAALAGGAVNRDSNILLIDPRIHPISQSGLVFGFFAAIAGCLLIPHRSIWLAPVIPIMAMLAFDITSRLMIHADRRLQDGGSVPFFILQLCLAALIGMALIAISLVLTRMLRVSAAVRFSIIGALTGALCVVMVKTASRSSRRFHCVFTGPCSAGSF